MSALGEARVAAELAAALLMAKHPDNPDAPLPMVRAGCALPLAQALAPLVAGWLADVWDEGYRDEGPRAHDPGYAERANPYRGGDA